MSTLTKTERSRLKQQRPATIWLTGLSGAGKSTIAGLIEQKLHQCHAHTYLLDGDKLREGLCQGLGFSDEDRNENIRRIGRVAALFCDAGLLVICATISPFHHMRAAVRDSLAPGDFIEVFVDAPLALCEARDPKGLYQRARQGKIAQFTGIGSAYEPPQSPEIHLRTDLNSAEACADQVIHYLQQQGYLPQVHP